MDTKLLTPEEFTAKSNSFALSVNQAWKLATELACDAIKKYHKDADTDRICAVYDLFEGSSGKFDKAYHKLLMETTDVGIRQDVEDLSKPSYSVLIKDKKVNPEWPIIIKVIERDGLKTYAGKTRSVASASRLNLDNKPKESSKKVSAEDAATSLVSFSDPELNKIWQESAAILGKLDSLDANLVNYSKKTPHEVLRGMLSHLLACAKESELAFNNTLAALGKAS